MAGNKLGIPFLLLALIGVSCAADEPPINLHERIYAALDGPSTPHFKAEFETGSVWILDPMGYYTNQKLFDRVAEGTVEQVKKGQYERKTGEIEGLYPNNMAQFFGQQGFPDCTVFSGYQWGYPHLTMDHIQDNAHILADSPLSASVYYLHSCPYTAYVQRRYIANLSNPIMSHKQALDDTDAAYMLPIAWWAIESLVEIMAGKIQKQSGLKYEYAFHHVDNEWANEEGYVRMAEEMRAATRDAFQPPLSERELQKFGEVLAFIKGVRRMSRDKNGNIQTGRKMPSPPVSPKCLISRWDFTDRELPEGCVHQSEWEQKMAEYEQEKRRAETVFSQTVRGNMSTFGVTSNLDELERRFSAYYEGCQTNACASKSYTKILHAIYLRLLSTPDGLRNSFVTYIGVDEGRDEFPHTATLLSEWVTLSLVGDPKYMNVSDSYAVDVSTQLPASTRCPPNERALPPRFFEPYDMQVPIASPFSAPLPDTAYFYPFRMAYEVARRAAGLPEGMKHHLALPAGGRGATPEAERDVRILPHDMDILSRDRPILFFSAASNVSCARVHVAELHACSLDENRVSFECPTKDILVFNGLLPNKMGIYQDLLFSSRYCLNLAGSWVTATVRLYDIIQSGCIPVIVTDDFIPPFADFLDWRKFAIFLRTVHVPHIERILRSIPKETEVEMRARLVQVRPAFSWQALPFWQLFWNTLRIAIKRRQDVLAERALITFFGKVPEVA